MGPPPATAVAFVEDVLGLDVEAELGRGRNAFGDGRVQPVQAIEQENLVRLQLNGFGGGAAAFLEAVDRLLNRFPAEQAGEMAVEQLDVQGFGGFVVTVVNPVGGMLNKRPEVVVEI